MAEGIHATVTADVGNYESGMRRATSTAGGFQQASNAAATSSTALGRAMNFGTSTFVRGQRAAMAAATRATQSFRTQRGAVQQLGFQAQDIAVQLQMGTNAMTVLGQQGSQIAGIFGPGGAVLGAIIATAAALGGVLFASLASASAEMDELEKEAKDLTEQFYKLTGAQREFAALQINEHIRTTKDVMAELSEESKSLKSKLNLLLTSSVRNETADELSRVNALLAIATDKVNEWQSTLDGTSKPVSKLIAGLKEQAATIGKSSREVDLYKAAQDNASPSQIAAINASYDSIEAVQAETKSLKDRNAEIAKAAKAAESLAKRQQAQVTRKDTSEIDALERSNMTSEQMIEESYKRRNEAVLRQTREGSARQNELIIINDEARMKMIETQTLREQALRLALLESFGVAESEAELLKHELKMEQLSGFMELEGATIAEFNALKEAEEQRHMDALTEIRKAGLDGISGLVAASYGKQAGQISGALGDMLGDIASHSKKAFEINKQVATGSAIVKGYEAATSAWAAGMATGGPWAPAVAAAYTAASIAKTGAQISAIQSQQFGGGGSNSNVGGSGSANVATPQQSAPSENQIVNLSLSGEMFGRQQVVGLIGQINEAVSDGARINLT